MTIMTVNILKKIIQNIPEDYSVEFTNGTTVVPVTDKVEIDISEEKIVLK